MKKITYQQNNRKIMLIPIIGIPVVIGLVCLLLFSFIGKTGTTKGASNFTENITPNDVSGNIKEPDDDFRHSQTDFALKLFKSSISSDKNCLISPLSVTLALSMTANGANSATLSEMEMLLAGHGNTGKIDVLNEQLYSYVNALPSTDKCRLHIANSIWFRDMEEFTVREDFLQKNADYYKAGIYKSAFDEHTLSDINYWVKKNTDGMIDKILDIIDENSVMYLINAITFDAAWETPYTTNDVRKNMFTCADGRTTDVDMMNSSEHLYIHDDMTTGFIKNYADANYAFVALLPNESIKLDDYINSLTTDGILNMTGSPENASVSAYIPKFSYSYDISMNDILKSLGMPTAFDPIKADFSGIGKSLRGNLYISNVIHKSFISVDELGTKAGATTLVDVALECEIMNKYTVKLDRPFVYMIMDNTTKLPIFIGSVTDVDSVK